ncbi:site-specific integrase [Streptomyces sp. NBC_00285]|uniref:tyrosine-type recombinase/integrase n=1 Tax=Streptomyces sp. NBC_00285 TaxID=2975700 RepID=UPI002E28FC96|nr:tyrosine-type recombinase/integrase [Streptomyces sp. NBC_00285]
MARRHSNGEGTTYQRKDGRWEGAVYVLTTSGVRKRVRVYGATRAEAHKKLTEAKAKNDQGIPAADKSWKLGDYLDYWLAEVVQRTKRPKTYEQYELICRLNLKPVLGHHTLAGLSVKAVQGFLNEQAAEGHYSSRRIEMMRNTLSAALRRAMREELISRNVARLVELPRAETQASEVIPWTIEEAQQFLATAQHHRLHAAFVLALFYGMRRGEVLGLRWQDIDFVEGTFDVRQQLQDVKGKIEVGPLKTNASRRGLPLIKVAADALVVLRDLTGSPASAHGLVFSSTTGTPLNPRNFGRTFRQLCTEAGVRIIKLHHQRHTAATIMLRLGIPPRVVQLILGHSHVSVTQQIYQHADMDVKRDALEALQDVLSQPTDSAEKSTEGADGNRSRQISRQSTFEAVVKRTQKTAKEKSPPLLWSTFFRGGPGGARTHDTLLKRSNYCCVHERTTEVKKVMERRTRRWILGVVAVDLAVRHQAQDSSSRCSNPRRADSEAA